MLMAWIEISRFTNRGSFVIVRSKIDTEDICPFFVWHCKRPGFSPIRLKDLPLSKVCAVNIKAQRIRRIFCAFLLVAIGEKCHRNV